MKQNNTILSDVDPWDRIDAMPDHRPLTSSEAAIFMTFSLATLERMRTDGTGPDYFQGGMRVSGKKGSTLGTNQHVRYFKEDIAAWFGQHKVSNAMEAAVRKGQAFATLMDLIEPAAFYVDARGDLAGVVEATPLQTVIERLGEWDIVWLPATEAAGRRWADLGAHQSFAQSVQRVLSQHQQSIAAGLEATELSVAIR